LQFILDFLLPIGIQTEMN